MTKSLCFIATMCVMLSCSYGAENYSTKPTSDDPISSNDKLQRSVEENVIHGVKNIEVPRPTCSSLEKCLLAFHDATAGNWAAVKTGAALEVKFQIPAPNPSLMVWKVSRNGDSYCIQPGNIASFLALRGDDFTDPAIVKYLCNGDCSAIRKADPAETIPDLPCFNMRKNGQQYTVVYASVKDSANDIEVPQPSQEARAALAKRILNETMKPNNSTIKNTEIPNPEAELENATAVNSEELSCISTLFASAVSCSGEENDSIRRTLLKCAKSGNEFERDKHKEDARNKYKELTGRIYVAKTGVPFGEYNSRTKMFPIIDGSFDKFVYQISGPSDVRLMFDKTIAYPQKGVSLSPKNAEAYLSTNPDRTIGVDVYFRFKSFVFKPYPKPQGDEVNTIWGQNYMWHAEGGTTPGTCDYIVTVIAAKFHTPDRGEIVKKY